MSEASEIMAEMDRTREEIRQTLGAIAERFTVDSLMQQVVTPAKEGTVELGRALGDAARANPVAVGLTAIGLGWLMFGSRPVDGDTRRRLEKVARPALEAGRSMAHDVADAAGRVAGKVRRSADRFGEHAGETADRARAAVHDLGEEASERASDLGDRLRRRAHHHGDRASSSVRHARERVYGAARETAEDAEARIRDRADAARGYARERAGRARDFARETADEARGYASEKMGRARDYVREGAETAREYAREGAERARHYLHDGGGKARDYAREGAEVAGKVGGYVREGAGKAGEYVREGAHKTTSYAREHPLAVGAVLVVGGATLALMLARRSGSAPANGQRDPGAAGMPETPYASGYQAVDVEREHDDVAPLTPEDEEQVYAAADISAEARPDPGAEGEADDRGDEGEAQDDSEGRPRSAAS